MFISETCMGEFCRCGNPAVRKIGEEIPHDDPNPNRHNFTTYVCGMCFSSIFGPVAQQEVGYKQANGLWEGNVIDFIIHGSLCKDCDYTTVEGVCDNTGLPCDSKILKTMAEEVISRLRYGFKHGFLPYHKIIKFLGANDEK